MTDNGLHGENDFRELLEASSAVLSGRSEEDILHHILLGLKAFGFDRVRLYLLSDDRQFLLPKAHLSMDENFMQTPRPVADDYPMQVLLRELHAHRFEREEVGSSPFGCDQWICAPLIVHGEVIGKLSADNLLNGRPILAEECDIVAFFAVQAATALEHSRLLTAAQWQAQKYAAVLQVSTSFNSSPNLSAILTTACQAAVDLLGVSHSALALFEPNLVKGMVCAEYPEMGMRGGGPIQLREVPAEEQLINSKAPVVISDVASDSSLGPVQEILLNRGIRSILLAPIVIGDKVLGSFSLDAIGKPRRFSQEEIELCSVFAAQVAVAINNKNLQEQFTSLVSSSPNAIITTDLHGKVTFLNNRAMEVIGYSASDLGPENVRAIYAGAEEPRRIRNLLHSSGGKFTDYETELKGKDGSHIPIRLSATWLYDVDHQLIGITGQFEDLRSLRWVNERLQLLSEVSTLVTQSEDPIKGLRQLAKLMVSALSRSFCRILFAEEDGQILVVKAAYATDHDQRPLQWNPHLNERVRVNKITGLEDILKTDDFRLLRLSNSVVHDHLVRFARHLGLAADIQSLLLIPLRVQEKLVGLLEIGEQRSNEAKISGKRGI